jgi:hypothetical protein
MKTGSFFAELKRRNVYKVAVAYAVVSWLLVQGASIVLPTFEAPPWTMKVLLVALVVFFPIAIVFAWAFEITPEGIRLEKDIEPDKSISSHTGRKLVGLTIVLAVIAAGLLAFQLLRPQGSVTPRPVSDEPRRDDSAHNSQMTAARAPISDKSIAVLPFDNLSDDKSNAYFTEGIQDEILTRLSKIAALKVISRTSTKKIPKRAGQFARSRSRTRRSPRSRGQCAKDCQRRARKCAVNSRCNGRTSLGRKLQPQTR